MSIYVSSKTFEHAFSCAFRQWRANSRCRYLHGYALTVRIEFGATQLDDRNWVIDFGALASLKDAIAAFYDHKTVIAEDDPHIGMFWELDGAEIVDLVTLPQVGCEAFARHIFDLADVWLIERAHKPRVHVRSVEVCEHGGNSATFTRV